MGVFEGIRGYETAGRARRLPPHRPHRAAPPLGQDHDDGLPYSVEELVQATKDTVRATGLPSCYIRPIAYYGYGEMGVPPLPCTVDVAIACWPWGAYLGDEALPKGVRMKISSWTRHDHNTMPPAAKTTGNYVNSSLAKVEALKAGYDEAIMLNPQGFVSECTGENIFVARHGKLITPPLGGRRPRGHHPELGHDASPATSASRCASTTSPAATSTSPRRSSCAAPRPRSRRSTRSTTAPMPCPGR